MEKLKAKLDLYNTAYANQPLISDDEYEQLLTKFNLLYGEYEPPVIKTSLPLPIFAPSLRKIKLEKDVNKWENDYQGNKIVMDKIDGISMIVSYTTDCVNIYTHTDSETGFDKSHLLPFLNLPKLTINKGEKIVVRGELAIKLETFEKYKAIYTSPRNMITGVVNKKEVEKEKLNDFTFLAFQMVYLYDGLTSAMITPLIQLRELSKMGFDIVTNLTTVNNVTYNNLKERLDIECPYLRDGLVVAQNEFEPLTPSLPKNKIAFKILGETEETIVIKVEWNGSRLNKLKPRIHYEPVFLSNASLTWTSGFNARFINKNNIGKGTKIVVTRSGDVNPYILDVVQGTTADLPNEKYTWDKNNTDIVIIDNDQIKIKRICYFFDTLGAKFLAYKTIEKLFNNKFDTINKILTINLNDLLKIDSIKQKSAERIIFEIKKSIDNATLLKVMQGSSLFGGFGKTKLENILNVIDIKNCDVNDIKKVDGINHMAQSFIEALPQFNTFLDNIPLIKDKLYNVDLPVVTQEVGTTFNGKVIVFSGDKKLTEQVKLLGGVVDNNVTKRTTLLVVDEVGSMNSKERMCIAKKIPIMSLKDFKEKYNL